MIFVYIIVVLIFWCICAELSVKLRKAKGYEGGYLIGFLFGVIALIYNAGLPDLILQKKMQNINTDITNQNNIKSPSCSSLGEHKSEVNGDVNTIISNHQWRCSNCGKMIAEDICPFCGYKH